MKNAKRILSGWFGEVTLNFLDNDPFVPLATGGHYSLELQTQRVTIEQGDHYEKITFDCPDIPGAHLFCFRIERILKFYPAAAARRADGDFHEGNDGDEIFLPVFERH